MSRSQASIEHTRKLSREAKRRRTGTCKECGGITRYNGKRGKGVSDICAKCSARLQHENRYWTRERLIAAVQRWAREHDGHPPRAGAKGDWDHARNGYPAFPQCYGRTNSRVAPAFASWADMIEAAGFPRPLPGRYERTPATRARSAEGMRRAWARRKAAA